MPMFDHPKIKKKHVFLRNRFDINYGAQKRGNRKKNAETAEREKERERAKKR